MKKLIALLLILCTLLGGCAAPASQRTDGLQIICTGFAQYDWVKNILGERLTETKLTLMATNNADLHNFQATVADLAAIADCDLFIYIGGSSDAWAKDALKNAHKETRKALALLEVGEVLETEHLEGAEEHHHEEHQEEEHIWLSLPYAQKAVDAICSLLEESDPANAALYRTNATAYQQKLAELDGRYRTAVEQAPQKTLLFADRFPFRYLTEDYSLEYYAAFSGCSSETEASFSTVAFLAQKMDELKLPCALVIESSDQTVAKTVINNTAEKDQKILVLDSIQARSQQRVEDGQTYLGIMEQNLTVLQQALGA